MAVKELKVGDEVRDQDGHRGIVVKIEKGTDDVNHGVVYVWQSERYEYGQDNCEHYVEFGWQRSLRVVKEKDDKTTS